MLTQKHDFFILDTLPSSRPTSREGQELLNKGVFEPVELDGWNSKQVFSKNELRLAEQPAENKEVEKPKPKNNYEKGVFLAFIPQRLPTGEALELYAINNTDWDFFTIRAAYGFQQIR